MTKPVSTSTSSHQHLDFSKLMDETEFKVAEILLQLPQLLSKSESLHRFSFTSWGRKRRRSSKAQTPSLPPVAVGSISEIEKKPKALSPATPLLFSPSESDDKSKHSKRKVSLKRVCFYFTLFTDFPVHYFVACLLCLFCRPFFFHSVLIFFFFMAILCLLQKKEDWLGKIKELTRRKEILKEVIF